MVKFLDWLIEKLRKRSKKPWVRFNMSGIGEDGQIEFSAAWNNAFIKNVTKHGYAEETEALTVQNFITAAILMSTNVLEDFEEQEVNSSAHPRLHKD